MTEDLKEIIRDVVTESHMSLSKIASNSIADFQVRLSRMEEHLIELKDYQKKQNGNVAKAIKEIDDLKINHQISKASFRTAKWIAGIAATIIIALIGTITTISAYAYNNDIKNVNEKIITHETESDKQYDTIISLLKTR